jgi:hypothetical protein
MEAAWVIEDLFYIGMGGMRSPDEESPMIATFKELKGQGPGTGTPTSYGR